MMDSSDVQTDLTLLLERRVMNIYQYSTVLDGVWCLGKSGAPKLIKLSPSRLNACLPVLIKLFCLDDL